MFWKLAAAVAAAVAASMVPALSAYWFWILLIGVAIAFVVLAFAAHRLATVWVRGSRLPTSRLARPPGR